MSFVWPSYCGTAARWIPDYSVSDCADVVHLSRIIVLTDWSDADVWAALRYVGMQRRSAGVWSPSITCTCPAGLTGFISTGLRTVITLIKPDHSGGNWILEDISSHGEKLRRQTRSWMNVKDISAICDRAGHTPALASRDKETRRTSRSGKKTEYPEKPLMLTVCFTTFQANWAADRLLKTLSKGNSLRSNHCWCSLYYSCMKSEPFFLYYFISWFCVI